MSKKVDERRCCEICTPRGMVWKYVDYSGPAHGPAYNAWGEYVGDTGEAVLFQPANTTQSGGLEDPPRVPPEGTRQF